MNTSFVEVLEKFKILHKPTLLYKDGDFFEWQKIFKEKMNAIRGRKINRVKLRAAFGTQEDCKTYYRQRVVIAATEISDATGYLLKPRNVPSATAAVIASPGHYEFGKDAVSGHEIAADELKKDPYADYGRRAVEAGFVVFVPDWWGWGDKSAHRGFIGQRDPCNVIQMAASMYGFSVLNLHMLEADAIVDFLQDLEYVDESRIGIIGNSYGGRTAMWIAAFNEKIRCVISAGAMNLFAERADRLGSCAIQYFPGLLEYGDVGEVFSLIAPRPLQLQAGDQDSLITDAGRNAIAETIKKAYHACGCPGNLSIDYFQGGHYLHWPLAQNFLNKTFHSQKDIQSK